MNTNAEIDCSGYSVNILRELFRHLQEFESFFEATGQDTLTNDGFEYSLWDIKRLFDYGQTTLPKRQRQAVFLCLYKNILEKDAAVMMGVSPTNPVMMYATRGLANILEKMHDGKIPKIKLDEKVS